MAPAAGEWSENKSPCLLGRGWVPRLGVRASWILYPNVGWGQGQMRGLGGLPIPWWCCVGFWSFCILLLVICPNWACTLLVLVLYSFFVFWCLRRLLSRCKPCSTGSQVSHLHQLPSPCPLPHSPQVAALGPHNSPCMHRAPAPLCVMAPCPRQTVASSAALLEETPEWSGFSLISHWACHLQGAWAAWPNLVFPQVAPGQALWPSQVWPGYPKFWGQPRAQGPP